MRDGGCRLWQWGLAGLLGLTMAACGLEPSPITVRPVSVQRIPAPEGDYSQVAWLRDDRLVVTYEPESHENTWGLWQLQPDGRNMKMLIFPEDRQRCYQTRFIDPWATRDGRLVFMSVCLKKQDNQGLHPFDPRVMIWDPRDNTIRLLRDYELPSHVATFTFAPDLSRGLLSTATRIEDTLFWLDAKAASPLNVGLVRAIGPSWSPDGRFIVFFGNRRLPGRPGPEWSDRPYDLWLMPAECEVHAGGCAKSLQVLVKGIRHTLTAAWSPDGRWLAFAGDLQGRGQGIWLYQMDTGALIQVAIGDYWAPAWSPNGERVVVTGPPEGGRQHLLDMRSALYILDVSEVVRK